MDAKKIEEVPFEEVYEVEKYGTYYSENKFWQKVQRVAKKVGATVILLLSMPSCFSSMRSEEHTSNSSHRSQSRMPSSA